MNKQELLEQTPLIPEEIRHVMESRDSAIEYIIRTYANPTVKGEITKGKLKWRGLCLTSQGIGGDELIWVSQRGVQIGPKVTFHNELKYD